MVLNTRLQGVQFTKIPIMLRTSHNSCCQLNICACSHPLSCARKATAARGARAVIRSLSLKDIALSYCSPFLRRTEPRARNAACYFILATSIYATITLLLLCSTPTNFANNYGTCMMIIEKNFTEGCWIICKIIFPTYMTGFRWHCLSNQSEHERYQFNWLIYSVCSLQVPLAKYRPACEL